MAQHMIMNAGSNWPHAGKGSSSNSCTVENVVSLFFKSVVSHILQIYIRPELEVLQPIVVYMFFFAESTLPEMH